MQDHFERLGLPRRFSVHPEAVEREYLARSRQLHPDFHQLGSAAEQRASLELTAALNEAYLTLKDPFRRADYLLRLLGGPTVQEKKNLDQAFLTEMMDVRERIEEAKATRTGLAELERHLTDRLADLTERVGREFAALESPSAADRRTGLIAVRRLLNAAKTIRSLLRDLRDD